MSPVRTWLSRRLCPVVVGGRMRSLLGSGEAFRRSHEGRGMLSSMDEPFVTNYETTCDGFFFSSFSIYGLSKGLRVFQEKYMYYLCNITQAKKHYSATSP